MLTSVFVLLEWDNSTFLGAFAILRKTNYQPIQCLCLCVFRTEQLGSHWADLHEISYLSVFRKFDRNNWPLT
jgi:hypothetical protein